MSTPSSSLPLTFLFFSLLLLFTPTVHASKPARRLQDTDPSLKCGGCSPCGGATCYLSPPPPPPVYTPPPPPKRPSSPPKPGCPPPPYSPGMIYIGAPPGELYPIDQTYSGSARTSAGAGFLAMLGLLILCL